MEVIWTFFTSPIHIAEGIKAVIVTLLATFVTSIFTMFIYLFVRLFIRRQRPGG